MVGEEIAVCMYLFSQSLRESINECFLHLNHPPSVTADAAASLSLNPYQKLLNIHES